MTYRDFTARQIAKFKRDCQKALDFYIRSHPTELVSPVQWQTAWSKAFISGVNQLESRYRNLSLFDESLKQKPLEVSACTGQK